MKECKHKFEEDYLQGICYCSLCGIVSDFRSYTTLSEGFANEGSSKQNTERSGSPTNLIYNKNFFQDDFDIKNLPIDLNLKVHYNRLKQWHRRITNIPVTDDEKVSNKTYTILSNLSNTLSLSRDFQKKVLALQEKMVKIPAFEEYNVKNLLCSIIFYLFKEEKITHSFSTLVSSLNLTRKNAARSYREVYKYLEEEKNKIEKPVTVLQMIEQDLVLFKGLSANETEKVLLEAESLYDQGYLLFSLKIPSKIARAILAQVLDKNNLFSLKEACKILEIPETLALGSGIIKELFMEYNPKAYIDDKN